MPKSKNIADASHARTLEEVNRAFQEVERQDLMVNTVVTGPSGYAAIMASGQADADKKGKRLWGGKIRLVGDDGVLICWDEEPE
jgi:hypothetical protein